MIETGRELLVYGASHVPTRFNWQSLGKCLRSIDLDGRLQERGVDGEFETILKEVKLVRR